jgi:hypothetical protein
MNLMCFDYKSYSTNSTLIGHHSPLHSRPIDSDVDKQLTVVSSGMR